MAAISTSPLYTVQNPGWNYEAVSYSAHELPEPLPARNDLLPWERKERTEKERQAHQATQTQRAYDNAARQKARGGFFNNMAASMKPRLAKWRATPMPVREAIPTKRDERKFNNKFHFPTYERLLYASELCKTVSGSQQILGKVYVSEHYFCFRESRLQPKGGRRQRLLLVIPIDDILSISQAEITSQADPRYAPDFRTLDQWHSKADGLFLFTREMKVHRFYGFWTQQTYHDTFNVLDRQWRSRPFTSTAPIRAGESSLNRSMMPPVASAAPSVAVLQPSEFQPTEPTTNFNSSMRSIPPYAAAGSMRQSSWTGRQSFAEAPASSSSSDFQGKEARRFSRAGSNRTLPRELLNDIRRASIGSLRRVGEPQPRYGHVLTENGDRLELVPLDSIGSGFSRSGSQRSFGLASQSRSVRSSHYVPKQQQPPQLQRFGSSYQQAPRRDERRRIGTELGNDIRHFPHERLHHVDTESHSSIPVGHIVTGSRGWRQDRTGWVPRERLGFQTVQQRLHSSQRGRSLDSGLRDEIGHFNLRTLHHVTPTVRQWQPQAADVRMRPAGGEQQRRHHHHHHRKHHRHGGDREQAPIQVFQYEEYDLASPNKYERIQTAKFQEQIGRKEDVKEQQSFLPTSAASRTYEAGTA